jgi:serine/threonine protein phosphatase PrpC
VLFASAATVIGPAHWEGREPNQDAVLLRGHRSGWFLAVADGLGSRQLSHVGSRLAVISAYQRLRHDLFERSHRDAIQVFYRDWLDALPGKAPGLMATTLLAASCNRDGRCVIAQLGDGLALYRSRGRFGALGDGRASFANETAALGVTKTFSAWRFAEVELVEPGDGVVLMTDGVADDLQPERLEGFARKLIRETSKRGRRRGKRWLEQQLAAWPTAMHADDKTIGMICRIQK